MRQRLTLLLSLTLLTLLTLGQGGCALFTPDPGRQPRDVIADADRSLQRLSGSIAALAPLIEDQTVREALDVALDEANKALADAHERERRGEPLDRAYLEDHVWSAINRALALYTKHQAAAEASHKASADTRAAADQVFQ